METTLHQFLKDSTRPNHDQAEGHPFQGALAQGLLPLASYRSYLSQLAHLHERYENKLRKGAATTAQLQAVVRDQYYQLPFLQADLQALDGKSQAEPPFKCVLDFTDSPTFDEHPVSMLGVLYVLLGSKHGGKFIARKVKEVYGLKDCGYTYFDPFGDDFRAVWQSFTTALNSLSEDEAVRRHVLSGANATFDIFLTVGDEIWRRQQSAVASQ